MQAFPVNPSLASKLTTTIFATSQKRAEHGDVIVTETTQTLESFAMPEIDRVEQAIRFTELAIEDVLQSIVRQRFEAIPNVESIYQNHAKFWIVTDETEYDASLMIALLSAEQEILRAFAYLNIDFEYLPSALCDHPRSIIGEGPDLIYQR